MTNSRIESKHRVYKRYLNDKTRLSELFMVFKELEGEEIHKMKNKQTDLNSQEKSKLEENELIKSLSKVYSEFAMKRVKTALIDAINYNVIHKERNLV